MSLIKCPTPLDIKFHCTQCVKDNYNQMEPIPTSEQYTPQIMSNLQVWATFTGSHLTRETTVSPVLTKWWNWELTLATNFGNPLTHAQMVRPYQSWWSKFLATNFGFVPDLSGRGPTGLRAWFRNRGRLENRSHVVPKTGLKDGGDRTRMFTHKIIILA